MAVFLSYKMMKKLIIFILILNISCSLNKKTSVENDFEVETIYFQKWNAGVQGGGSGINFYVIFKNHLDENFKLDQLKFESYEAKFEQVSDREFVAKIKTFENDILMDKNPEKEYGNIKPKNTILNTNEALLIFFNKETEKYYAKRVQNIKEKPMLSYPSMGRPKN